MTETIGDVSVLGVPVPLVVVVWVVVIACSVAAVHRWVHYDVRFRVMMAEAAVLLIVALGALSGAF